MIRVNVHLFSILRHRPDGTLQNHVTLELPEGATVADVLRQLQVPELPILIEVNEQQAEETTRLQDGDKVDLIPAIAGGEKEP
jgi:sulfur carrier protein ThiS